ncbi:indolepyruvate ferredoxin oxidoreductase family protein [Sphingomonas oligophenolica]|uniref:Indolepyruvate ferredoxin oxidoreductase family protein n=1 Tax=Sphingomonas oligophenolica TaxID=301154 RepID=A0ABU9Y6E2_9SPHN
MTTATSAPREAERNAIRLSDKWELSNGRIMISGTQAIARVLLAQRALDGMAGLNTAGYISGYRGSPLGGVDTVLWSVAKQLDAADVTFQPGVNEDLAATAVRGTQQIDFVPGPRVDGVFAAWYGKGPGVDRSIDALKHGNYAGSHPKGGVTIFYGDDHGGKSSTVAHHSEQAMASARIPSLYPADVGEVLRFGLLANALSRYSGSWVGVKLVNEVAEQTETIDIDLSGFDVSLPPHQAGPPEGLHVRRAYLPPVREEQIVDEFRLPLVMSFVRANGIDRTEIRAPEGRLALVTAGKSYGDTRRALRLLDLSDERAAALGVSLYKVGCIWPLESAGLRSFAEGHEVLFFIEEKAAFLEPQAARAFVNDVRRPFFIGKQDEDGAPLLSSTLQLDPFTIALALAERLHRLGIHDDAVEVGAARLLQWASPGAAMANPLLRRAPFFCSGCPHNRSTKVPPGSLSMTGIGCHAMVGLARPAEALPPTHMGAEGMNWTGLAPFTTTRHIFQNMGDGTYYHSGLMAIRAAVASGTNITYKILYNDAVAMTGGQPVDGPLSVAEIAQQVRHEGVGKIIVLSENPDTHRGNSAFPADVRIGHRDELDAVQRELRELPGCTVLIYEQTCAAEKRRRRKRGLYPDPPTRLHITPSICEGCGDCSVQSTCMSLQPLPTDFGVKRRIDQSSCNKDMSCLKGFCPSFITVHNPDMRKRPGVSGAAALPDIVRPATVSLAEGSCNLLIAGIGGTGVITVGAIIGMAAHLDGNAASLFDMTGLAQKNGAVFSHVRIGANPSDLHAQRLSRGETDVLLAFDLVAAMEADAVATLADDRSHAVVNSAISPTVAFQFNAAAVPLAGPLVARLEHATLDAVFADATYMATAIMGDSVGANLFMVGIAAQNGLLPVSVESIERAIRLNGTAVDFNIRAFTLGRLFVTDSARVEAMLPSVAAPAASDDSVAALINRRMRHLTAYQNEALANRYQALVERVRTAELAISGGDALTRTVAANYAKVLSYKDEYEVARLLTDARVMKELRDTFGEGASFSYNLAPPILNGALDNGRPRKRAFKMSSFKPVLHVMAWAKFLRGSAFDPFGYFAERRAERALIGAYEQLVDTVLAEMSAERLDKAIAVLNHVDSVRGFGPVKDAALKAYAQTLPQKIEALRAPDLAAAA